LKTYLSYIGCNWSGGALGASEKKVAEDDEVYKKPNLLQDKSNANPRC